MLHKFIAAAAWATLAFIAFATLSPLGLRPEIGDANLERFGAYALAGLLMALAYPRHLILVAIFVVGAAAVLEVLQLVTPDRHGQFANAVVKAAGGMAGVVVAIIISHLTRANLDRLG
jgi:VanZ family protein